MKDERVGGAIRGRKINPDTGKRDDKNPNIKIKKYIETRTDGKANCMTTVQTDSMVVDKTVGSCEGYRYRKLSCIEAERLQTLPDNYTAGESNSQRYRMIGNGWNVETIMVFFDALKVELMRRKVAA
jgi:site-specific DNA-cytosine methylase